MQNGLVNIVFLILLSQGLCFDPKKSNKFEDFDEVEKVLTFRLYTRGNPDNGVVLIPGDKARLINSGFKGVLPTILCCHGYFDDTNASWVKYLKRGVLQEEVNFITVDFAKVSHNLLYDEIVNFTKPAGLYTGQFLKFLQKEGKLSLEKTHLIGHSLGAHLLSFARNAFPVKKALGRLTALDPAGPLFENAPDSERVNPDSAKVVDVIHTCRYFIGMKRPVGTIDFYPNGGYHQRGCKDFDLNCQHARSRDYFYETVGKFNRNMYTAKKCETIENAINGSCFGESATMGYYLNYSSPGIYYLKVN